jgi:hypothetical protein
MLVNFRTAVKWWDKVMKGGNVVAVRLFAHIALI